MTLEIFLLKMERDIRLSHIALLILVEIANSENFLQTKQRDVRYSAKNFVKSSFSDISKRRVANGTELHRLNQFQ